MEHTRIGRSAPRREGPAKLSGQSKYIDDLSMPNLMYGVTVRSTVPRAKIRKIHFLPGIEWDEYVVVTAKDIPGKNIVTLILEDQPFLADQFVNHFDEPILLIAHSNKWMAEKSKKYIKIEYEELPAVFTINDSINKKEIVWGQDNTFKQFHLKKGSLDTIWESADFVFEGEYSTGAQEQLYIENNGMIALADENGVTVWGSLQCPYYVHKALKPLFNLPPEKIRVIQAETGGGFGGKEEYPSILAGHAALLSLKAKCPVKMIYSRAEDIAATTKRHPSYTKIKTAFSNSGKILGTKIEFIIDGGAYCTLSPVVLSRGTIHAVGPYNVENVEINSYAVATNHPPHGAFRGFGAPQSIFAWERHLDDAAEKLKITPEQIRRLNFLKTGEKTATHQVIKEKVDFDELFKEAFELSDYHNKVRQFEAQNKNSRVKKGIGFATFMHGAGFTGSGEKHLASVIGVQADKNGQVEILAASTEIGQGTNTIFSQIAATALGIDYDMVSVAQPDTARVPDSGPTVASRTCMIVGKLVESAAIGLKQTLIAHGLLKNEYSSKDFAEACKMYISKNGELKCFVQYSPPPGVEWDDKLYKGEAYASYAWALYLAEVSVDTVTYETKVDDFIALQEVGRVIHPTLAAGQIEGGVAQGIGFALYEKVVYKNGQVLNNQMTNYVMPTAADVPIIRVDFYEHNFDHGPSGAKGIGELPMDGPAPAIMNAIKMATGISVNHVPMLPEDLMKVMGGQWKK